MEIFRSHVSPVPLLVECLNNSLYWEVPKLFFIGATVVVQAVKRQSPVDVLVEKAKIEIRLIVLDAGFACLELKSH